MRGARHLALALAVVAAGACGGDRGPPPPLAGIPLALAVCGAPEVDADHDALDDRCELALARAFAPELVVDARDCLWRADAVPPRLDGAYLFAAQRSGAAIRVAYLPAYYRDCGWSGAACTVRGGDCGAHDGDSELVVVDVVPDSAARRWRTVGVFLSAHCFGRSDGRCRWFRGDELRALTWAAGIPGGAPRVWVARGKHAHYPSRRACDGGHWFYDSCDDNRVAARFPVDSPRQNVGSRAHPHPVGGCLTTADLPLGPAGTSPGTRECIWDPATPFRGWQTDSLGAAPTPYARVLAVAAGF